VVSIQFSYTSPSNCRSSSPFGNLVSCSPLIFCLCSLNYFSYKDVIYGISYLCSFNCLSCGDVICGTSIVYLVACTIVGIAYAIVSTAYGSTLPFIIFYALYICALLFLLHSWTWASSFNSIIFLNNTFGKVIATFFLFSSVVYIFSSVL
jgi:hypothetical protein